MQCLAKAADGSLDAKMELTQLESGLTVQKCVQGSPMVNRRAMKQEFVQAIFELLNRFCSLVNVGKNFNEDQMIQMSFDLYERFSGESLEDVALFLKKARSGEFGEFYRLDTTVVMKWADAYMDEKTMAFEEDMRNRENIRRRQENDAVAAHIPDEKAKAKLQELSERLAKYEPKKPEKLSRNPFFNYDAYCEKLEATVGAISDKELALMLANTSQYQHPRVWDIVNTENELRKTAKKAKPILHKSAK